MKKVLQYGPRVHDLPNTEKLKERSKRRREEKRKRGRMEAKKGEKALTSRALKAQKGWLHLEKLRGKGQTKRSNKK